MLFQQLERACPVERISGAALFYTRLTLFQQKASPRDTGTHQICNIRQQNKAFSEGKKLQFWLPLDRSHKRNSSGGHFCRTSPAKLTNSSHRKLFLGVSNSFGSLYVRKITPSKKLKIYVLRSLRILSKASI